MYRKLRPARLTPTHQIVSNNGNGTFTDVSEQSGIAKWQLCMTAVTALHDDGWPDISWLALAAQFS
jgi:hypothetical protein